MKNKKETNYLGAERSLDQEIANLEAELAIHESKTSNSASANYLGTKHSLDQEIARLEAEIAAKQGGLPPVEDVKRSLGDASLRQVKRIGRATATGLASLADIPNIAAPIAHKIGLKETAAPFYDSIGGKTQKAIDNYTGGNLRAENKLEEYIDSGIEAVAPLILAPVTGGASLTGTAAQNVARLATNATTKKIAGKVAQFGAKSYAPTAGNVAGSLGGAGASKYYMDNTEDPGFFGAMAAGIAGGGGARSVVKGKRIGEMAKDLTAKTIGKATKWDSDKYYKYTDADLPVTPSNVSKGDFAGKLETIMSHVPGNGKIFKKVYSDQERVAAKNMGVLRPDDLEQAVKNPAEHLVKEGAKGYDTRVTNFYGNKNKKFAPLENRITDEKQLFDMSSIIDPLEAKRALSLTPKARARFDKTGDGKLLISLKESAPDNIDPRIKIKQDLIQDLRNKKIGDSTIDQIVKKEGLSDVPDIAPNTSTAIGYHDLNIHRKNALDEKTTQRTALGLSTQESKAASKRHSSLAGKRHDIVEEVGNPSEKRHSEEARGFYARYKDKKTGTSKHVDYLLKSADDSQAITRLVKDPKKLNVVRQGLKKEELPQLVDAVMSTLGKKNGRYNVSAAHSGFTDLSGNQQTEILKTISKYSKSAKKNFLTTMDFIGDNKKRIEKVSNRHDLSSPADNMRMISKITKIGGSLATGAGAYATGLSVPLALAWGANKLGSKMWTNQNFMKSINQTMTATNPAQKHIVLTSLLRTMNQEGRKTKEHEKITNPKKRQIPVLNVPGEYVSKMKD